VKLTPELELEICRRVADGESLTTICKDPAMPSRTTVQTHLRDDASFRAAYQIAQVDRMHVLGDEIIAIADAPPPMDVDEDGNRRISNAGVQQQRLRVDTRKWLMAHMAPKAFGDRVAITGADGAFLSEDDDIDLARRVAFALSRASETVQRREARQVKLIAYEPEDAVIQ